MPETELQPLLVRHAEAMRMGDWGDSYYWGLVRAGKITKVGSGKAGRAYLPSVTRYIEQLLAEAEATRAAAGGRPDPGRSARMAAVWAARKATREIARRRMNRGRR
jgi:hypothetical protein